MATTINTETMSRDEIISALDGAATVTDGVSDPWDPALFIDSLDADTGRPVGEYRVFTADEWAREIEESTQD